MRAKMRTSIDHAHAASSDAGQRDRDAEQQHRLAAVPVAQRAEPQHRRREPERVADGDEVELRLRRVEVQPDVGERDVGDRQRQVRDRGDDDQRAEDHTRARRGTRVRGRRCALVRHRVPFRSGLCAWPQANAESRARNHPPRGAELVPLPGHAGR